MDHQSDTEGVHEVLHYASTVLREAGIALTLSQDTTLNSTLEDIDLQYHTNRIDRVRDLIAMLQEEGSLSSHHCENIISNFSQFQEQIYLQMQRVAPSTGNAIELVSRNASAGRPRLDLDTVSLETLIEEGFTYTQIANILNISRRTLYNRRRELGVEDRLFSEISDQNLEEILESYFSREPNAGEVMAMGFLRSQGIYIQRHRLRSCIHRVLGTRVRQMRLNRIARRKYSVPGPLSLVHIDGNHKLIRWKLVIHGGIDGFSRLIFFLQASNNNKASTVLSAFMSGVQKYGLPSRVRSDKGGENEMVKMYMERERGMSRGSMLMGTSVHNQRIERLWVDVYRSVLFFFYDLFSMMEQEAGLDPDDPIHIFALHFVFLPRINARLDQFIDTWDNHTVRTEGLSPRQMFISGSICFGNRGYHAADIVEAENSIGHDIESEEDYGIEDLEEFDGMEECEGVAVNPVMVNISERQEHRLQRIDPLFDDGELGVAIWRNVVAIMDVDIVDHNNV